MLAKEHVIFSILLSFPLILLLIFKPIYLIIFLIGLILGSLIPDIDEENSYVYKLVNKIQKRIIYLKEKNVKKFEEERKKLTIQLILAYFLYIYALLIKYLIYKPLAFFTKEQHRGITHTIYFPIIYVAFLFLILYFLKLPFKLAFWFLLGNFLGVLFHILGDSLTKSGIAPFYFGIRLKGKYLTGKDSNVPIKIILLFLILTILLKLFFEVSWIFYYILVFLYFIYIWVSSGG